MTEQLDLSGRPELDFTSERAKDYAVGYTPLPVARLILERLARTSVWLGDAPRILDPGAGSGSFGHVAREIWPNAEIVGVEAREEEPANPAYDAWHTMELEAFAAKHGNGRPFDLVAGNPPFKLARHFVEASRRMLDPSGTLAFLLLTSWWQRGAKMHAWAMDTHRNIACSKDYRIFRNLWDAEHPIGGAIGFYGKGHGTDQRSYSFFEWGAVGQLVHNDRSPSWETTPFPSVLPSGARTWTTPPGRT